MPERSHIRAGDTRASALGEALDTSWLWIHGEDNCPINFPVFIQLLGRFGLLRARQPVTLPGGGKLEVMLSILALHPDGVPREKLHSTLWPSHDRLLAGQSFNSLVYSLRKLLNGQLGGAPPVLCDGSSYRLNYEAGMGVDLDCFDGLMSYGNRCWCEADFSGALVFYSHARRLYRGDLYSPSGVAATGAMGIHAAMERERLRVCHLGLLILLAD
jgi:hypothetical protein